MVMERLPYKQYLIKVDGSGRLSRRNRRHLKFITTEEVNDPAYPTNQTGRGVPDRDEAALPLIRERSSRTIRKPGWFDEYVM